MKKINSKLIAKQIVYSFVAIVSLLAYFPNLASASQVTNRKLTIGNSVSAATTTYKFDMTLPTSQNVRSVSFQFCAAASGACTTPNLFDASTGVTLASQPTNFGDASGWTTSNQTGAIRIINATNSTNPTGTSSVTFNGVKNPTLANNTFYVLVTTYSAVGFTGVIDTGTFAASTAGQVTVNANVDETLTFTLATASISLSPNPLTSSTTGSGTSTMTAATNAANGYTISYSGNTLTSGANTLTAMTGGASQTGNGTGNSQFGINLVANTTPAVGSNVSTGTNAIGVPKAGSGYETANSFKFVAGSAQDIATASGPSNANTFTTSYIANIASTTPAGAYTTTLTYVATANF